MRLWLSASGWPHQATDSLVSGSMARQPAPVLHVYSHESVLTMAYVRRLARRRKDRRPWREICRAEFRLCS